MTTDSENTEAPAPAQPSKVKKTAAVVWALGIVALIVLLLGAIATPKFIGFACKSKQSEAKTNLSQIFTAQRAYFEEHGHFAADAETLRWQPDGTPVYEYGIAEPSPDSADTFVAMAEGNIDRDDTLDVWTIDEGRELINETNDCSR